MSESPFIPPSFEISREFNNELRKAGELLDVGSTALRIAEQVLLALQTVTETSGFLWVSHFLFVKAFQTAQSAHVLCQCGYGSDGLSLCASLFENLVDLLYIKRAPVKRSLRFAQFEQLDKYLQAEKILKTKRLPRGRRKIYLKYASNLLPQVTALLPNFKVKGRGWSEKTLAYRAKAVGAGLAYQELYWVFCGHKHTLPMVTSGLTINPDVGDPGFSIGSHMIRVCDAVEQSTLLLLKICRVTDLSFSLNCGVEIDGCFANLNLALGHVRFKHPEFWN